jgi:hypothetical protein
MTTILYHGERLFADSTIFKGSDRLHSLEKIVMLDLPFRILCDGEHFKFDDIVYGYSGTGNQDAMAAFAKHLETSIRERESSKMTIALYEMMAHASIIIGGNTFEIFMIGKEANHSFRLDEAGFLYIRYEKDQTVALGSGSRDVIKHIQHHRDPVRAMFETFFTEEHSGGWIDCWGLLEQDGLHMFRRLGMCEPMPADLIRLILDKYHRDSEEMPLQFVRNSTNQQFMKSMATQNEKLFQQNKRLKKQLDILKQQGVPIPVVPAQKVAAKKKSK